MNGEQAHTRSEWLRFGSFGLVLLGGTVGAAAREALSAAIPSESPVPVAILIANLLGAFLLGVLLESLDRRDGPRDGVTCDVQDDVPRDGRANVASDAAGVAGSDAPTGASHAAIADRRGPRLRLLLGTGALGGFTTYSALAFAVVAVIQGGQVWLGIAYGLGTLVFGALATFLGIALAERWRSRRSNESAGRHPEASGGADA